MVEARQLDVFALHESAVSVFQIVPDEACTGELRTWIELAGGIVLDPQEDDPYKIPILDANWYLNVKKTTIPKNVQQEPRDIFLPSFIYECYNKERVMDLNKYRFGGSCFEKYNSNKILKRELRWTDLTVAKIAVVSKTKGTEQVISNGNVNGIASANNPKRHRHEYQETNKQPVSVQDPVDSDSSDYFSKRFKSSGADRRPLANSPHRSRRILSDTESRTSSTSNPNSVKDSRSTSDSGTNLGKWLSAPTTSASSTAITTSSNLGANIQLPGVRSNAFPIKISNSKRKRQRAYTIEEGQAILDFICNNDFYNYTGGNRIWEQMEEAKVGEERTYQSLKEHFRKAVYKNLHNYRCSDEQKKRLKRGMEEKFRGRRKQLQAR